MNMMVTLTLMHVVGFKMPVNIIFDVEFEGLRLCTREGLRSSWPDLTVKAQTSLGLDHYWSFSLYRTTAEYSISFSFLWLSFTHAHLVSRIRFTVKTACKHATGIFLTLNNCASRFLVFLQQFWWGASGKAAALLAKSAAFIRDLSLYAYRFDGISADTKGGLESCSPGGMQVEGIISDLTCPKLRRRWCKLELKNGSRLQIRTTKQKERCGRKWGKFNSGSCSWALCSLHTCGHDGGSSVSRLCARSCAHPGGGIQ